MRTKPKTIQAKHLSDERVLRAVADRAQFDGEIVYSVPTSDVAKHFPSAPYKVVAAKLSRLLHRGLLDGCDCGCFGDWKLTEAGVYVLGGHRGHIRVPRGEIRLPRSRPLVAWFTDEQGKAWRAAEDQFYRDLESAMLYGTQVAS